jgi:hypothetical protein
MTDYNDGKWHGWNGGECPVHPLTVVETRYLSAPPHAPRKGEEWIWSHDGNVGDIVAFRVTKAYTEPKEYSGTCYVYHYTSFAPTLAENNVGDWIKGKWTATHIDGKLAKITWEATE